MPIHFNCPVCKTPYTVNDLDVGKKSDCQKCGQRLQVPAPVRAKTILGEIVPPELSGADRPKVVHWTDAPLPSPPATPPSRPIPMRPVSEPTPASVPDPEPEPAPRRRDRYVASRGDRTPLYNNEESVRFRTDLTGEELERVIEDVIGRLGYVQFFRGGEFEIGGGRFQSFATDVKMAGSLSRSRREDEWILSISYSVMPSAVCWVIAVIGFICILVGPLIFLMPYTTKGNVQRAVSRAVREARDEVEGRDR